MTMIENTCNQHEKTPLPSNRKFGLVFGGLFLVMGLISWFTSKPHHLWPWVMSGIFFILAWLFPRLLAPLNRIWMGFGDILHKITSPIILGLMFYVLLVPIGTIMRIVGKKPISLEYDAVAETYWIKRDTPESSTETFKNQF